MNNVKFTGELTNTSVESTTTELFTKTIQTPKGTISVQEVQGEYPGMYVSINGIALVLVEYDNSNDEHAIRVWSNEYPDDDYHYKQSIPDNFGVEIDDVQTDNPKGADNHE